MRVVAGILRDDCGRVLIADRPAGKSMAGWWEFPGGKIAAGEDAPAALVRELREELGIEVRRWAPLLELVHDYPDRRVELSVWQIEEYLGRPRAQEGQALQWLAPEALESVRLLPADAPIVQCLLQRDAAGG